MNYELVGWRIGGLAGGRNCCSSKGHYTMYNEQGTKHGARWTIDLKSIIVTEAELHEGKEHNRYITCVCHLFFVPLQPILPDADKSR